MSPEVLSSPVPVVLWNASFGCWSKALFFYRSAAQQQYDLSCHTPPELARTNIFFFLLPSVWYIIQREQHLCPCWFFPTTLILQSYRRLVPTVNSLMHVSFLLHVSSASLSPLSSLYPSLQIDLFLLTCIWHQSFSCSITLVRRCVALCASRSHQVSYCTLWVIKFLLVYAWIVTICLDWINTNISTLLII